MAASVSPLLLLLAITVHAALCIEVDNKLDLWDEDEYENEVEPRPSPQKVVDVQVVDVQVVVPIDNAALSAGGDHPDVPVYVPVSVVTPPTRKPTASHPWKHHSSFAPTTTAAKDVPVYVPIASSGTSSKMRPKVPVGDVPVFIGSSGVKHVKPDGPEKTAPVVIPININISSGKEDKSRPPPSDVPVIVGTGNWKSSTTTTTTTSTIPPDVPVVVGLKLGPQFHRRADAGFAGRPLTDRTFWLPPGVGFVPRPLLPQWPPRPYIRPHPWQPPPRPAPAAPSRPATTTAAPLSVDDKLDFGDA